LLLANLLFSQTVLPITWGTPDFTDCGNDGSFQITDNIVTLQDIEGNSRAFCQPCTDTGPFVGLCSRTNTGEVCSSFNSGPAVVSTNQIDISQFEEVEVEVSFSTVSSFCNGCNISDLAFISLSSSTKGFISQYIDCVDLTNFTYSNLINVDCGEFLTTTVGAKVNSTEEPLAIETIVTGIGLNAVATPMISSIDFSNPFACPGESVTIDLDLSNCDAGCRVIWTPTNGGLQLGGTSVTIEIPESSSGIFDYDIEIGNGICPPFKIPFTFPFIQAADVEDAIIFPDICVGENLDLPNPILYEGSEIIGSWSGNSVSSDLFSPTADGSYVITFTSANCGILQFDKTIIVSLSDCNTANATSDIPTLGQWV